MSRPARLPARLAPLLLAPLLAAGLTGPAPVAARDWQPAERIETYAITGSSGIELYRSIGERAPSAGVGRAIAHTDFELLWTRDYRPQPDGSCAIAVARPSLTIIYRWPRAPAGLSPQTAARWARFIAGVETHERIHGDHLVEMTEKIRAFSLGLSAPDDPGCEKVRARLQSFLAEMAAWRLDKARSFDREEMSEGGNVHRLILELVNP
jgi:predicted secreted Zn-dependent protease